MKRKFWAGELGSQDQKFLGVSDYFFLWLSAAFGSRSGVLRDLFIFDCVSGRSAEYEGISIYF